MVLESISRNLPLQWIGLGTNRMLRSSSDQQNWHSALDQGLPKEQLKDRHEFQNSGKLGIFAKSLKYGWFNGKIGKITILSISSNRNTGLLTPAVFNPWTSLPGIDPMYVLRWPLISDWSETPPSDILENTNILNFPHNILNFPPSEKSRSRVFCYKI